MLRSVLRCIPRPGVALEFEYPVRNRLDVPLEYIRRRIQVEEVRQILSVPLEANTIRRNPLVRRGSILITGIDIALGARRSFYLEAVRGVCMLPSYRLGLYNPSDPGDSPEFIGPEFAPTRNGRMEMREAIEVFNKLVAAELDVCYCLAAFPVDVPRFTSHV